MARPLLLWFAAGALAALAAYYTLHPATVQPGTSPPTPTPASTQKANQPEFVKNLTFDYDRDWGEKPLVLRGQVAKTASRLRLYVQYYQLGHVGELSRLIPLTELNDVTRDQTFQVPLIYKHKVSKTFYVGGRARTEDVEELFWVNEKGPEVSSGYPYWFVRANIVVIGPDGTEQHATFGFLRVSPNTKLQIFGMPGNLVPQ